MQKHLDDELRKMKTSLLRMAILTERAIHNSVEALRDLDKNRAQENINNDKQIDDLENSIEEHAIELLALFQPMARDLRFITTGMRINSELESIADLTVNICQRVTELSDRGEPLLKPLIDIPKLGDIAKKMVKDSIDAFVKRDQALAREVILTDKQANDLRTVIVFELINDFIVKDGTLAPRAIPLLLVARDLERVCDHATCIAEDVIYMVKARMVKHHPERLNNGKQ